MALSFKFGKKYEKNNRGKLVLENVRMSHSILKERFINEEKILEYKEYEIFLDEILIYTGYDGCLAMPIDLAEGVLKLNRISYTDLAGHEGLAYECPVYENVSIDIIDKDNTSKRMKYELTFITGDEKLNGSFLGILGIRGLEILGADVVENCHFLSIQAPIHQTIGLFHAVLIIIFFINFCFLAKRRN